MSNLEKRDFEGASLDDALELASDYFNVKLEKLEYEIKKSGKKTTFGLFNKSFLITAWVGSSSVDEEDGVDGNTVDEDVAPPKKTPKAPRSPKTSKPSKPSKSSRPPKAAKPKQREYEAIDLPPFSAEEQEGILDWVKKIISQSGLGLECNRG